MRIIFAGTPEFSVHTLQALLDSEHEVVQVLTQPDRPKGRGKALEPSPVKKLALAGGLRLDQPRTLKTPEGQQVLVPSDVMVVVAYGLILPKEVLMWPRYGCVNVHASLLPRWRGASPIQQSILAGDQETGVSIMQLDEGMDTGPVYHQEKIGLTGVETGDALFSALAPLGAQAMLHVLKDLPKRMPTPQSEQGASHAGKIKKSEARIDWCKSACEIERMIRAYQSWPMAFSEINGQRILFWQARVEDGEHHAPPGTILGHDNGLAIACGHGILRVDRCQVAGKPARDWVELCAGYRTHWAIGQRFFSL